LRPNLNVFGFSGDIASGIGARRQIGAASVNKRVSISLVGLIYIVVGIVVAVSRHYITIAWLKLVGSALLAVFLWWLLLLGVNLHLH
jgi:hypothetical protein